MSLDFIFDRQVLVKTSCQNFVVNVILLRCYYYGMH